jgi:tripartite-type tricarboxylate transporter receptor subunit TctC
VQLILANLAMARPFVAPPDVPSARLEALRAAFEATAKDPAFLAAAKQARRIIRVYTAAQIDALLKKSYALPQPVVQRALEVSTPRK